MKRLIIVLSEKGGIAKSFLAVHLITYLAKQGHQFRGVDLDITAGITARVFGPGSKNPAYNISPSVLALEHGESNLPGVIEAALAGEQMVIDCGSNTGPTWEALFQVRPDLLNALAKEGRRVTLVVPVSSDAKSTEFYRVYRDQMFSFATVVMVVVREYKEESFSLPEHDSDKTFELPLAPKRLFSTYRTLGLSMDEIATRDEIKPDSGFARGYLQTLHKAFDSVKQHLLPQQ